MSTTGPRLDTESALTAVEQAVSQGTLSNSAAENLRSWLTEPRYSKYAPEILSTIAAEDWQTLDDVFWTVIPFGTGGRRGRMHPFGSNAINERTIGESAQGLADYVKSQKPEGPWACGLGYDTRHRSREFAELCAGILVANGFQVYFIDDYRSTPELSFLVRNKSCDCGIMVTASHNPPSDNAVKVYWSTGGQLVPPHDKGVIECVERVGEFAVADFQQAVAEGKVQLCREEIDAALLEQHLQHSLAGDSSKERDLGVVYSPLHGVGEFNVRNLFVNAGFGKLEIFEPHRAPDGDFPNVPGHVSNPENPAVFDAIIERCQQTGAELALATDPDCDRMGAAAPVELGSDRWATLNGNQLGALLCDFVLLRSQELGRIRPQQSYVITTLVTTPLIRRICQHYGVLCLDENLVGFKWIGDLMDRQGPDDFLFGCEESHGFLVGQYCRDKDGAIACLLMAELAEHAKAAGQSVHQRLQALYQQHGYHHEQLITIRMEGSDGMKRMEKLMGMLRDQTPWQLGQTQIAACRDYHSRHRSFPDGTSAPISGPQGNLIVLETSEPGNTVAIRPSGTEPKIKLYLFGYAPAGNDLGEAEKQVGQRLARLEADLRQFADSVS